MIPQADSSLQWIRTDIRRLTVSASEQLLPTDVIDQWINTVYNNDFPYAIKLDQMRSVYTFYTRPYVDKYPLDVNYTQGIRAPVYFEGIQGYLYKDRNEFFNLWPRWPTKFNPFNPDGTFQGPYSFTIPGPFLAGEVTLGGVDNSGAAISVADDGMGGLNLVTPNPQISVPNQYSTAPGMYNQNTQNPGQDILVNIGSVNYVTGEFNFSLPVPPAAGSTITLWVSQYQPGRPYSLLFWNNYFLVRPIPKLIHKVEVEVYLTPVQFMATTDSPILNQWKQWISLCASMRILERRQDTEGAAYLQTLLTIQEGRVLERQGVEEINSRNATIFSASTAQQGWNMGYWQGFY